MENFLSTAPRLVAWGVFLTGYFFALCGAWVAYVAAVSLGLPWSTGLAVLAGAGILFLFSLVFRNNSLASAYPKLFPLLLILFWGLYGVSRQLDVLSLLLLALPPLGLRFFQAWDLSLAWKGFAQEDWRVLKAQPQSPLPWPWYNLLRFHLYPAALGFVTLIPLALSLLTIPSPGIFIFLASGLMVLTGTLHRLADLQMKAFRRRCQDPRDLCVQGLWGRSRHPNYFFEILFWWASGLGLIGTPLWPWIFCALAPTLHLILVALPEAEQRLKDRNPVYAQLRIPLLVPALKPRLDPGKKNP